MLTGEADKRVFGIIIQIDRLISCSGDTVARKAASGHRAGDWGPTALLGAERMGVSECFSISFHTIYVQDVLKYTPGRIYQAEGPKRGASYSYQRLRSVDTAGLKMWARQQARTLSLYLRDRRE